MTVPMPAAASATALPAIAPRALRAPVLRTVHAA